MSEQKNLDPDIPPFCRQPDDPDAGPDAGKGHPEKGWAWCEKELREGHLDDAGELAAAAASSSYTPIEPFCRNGAGHPEFGNAWCREKAQIRRGGVPTMAPPGELGGDEGAGEEWWCITGRGHPVFGPRWCTMNAEERARFLKEREERKRESENPPGTGKE